MYKALFPAIGLLAFATAAGAHITLEQSEAAVGATTRITLRIPHGCEGEATNTLRVSLPDGFYDAKPMPKAGWKLETVTGAYAKPYDNYGDEETEGVREIIWSGGDLEDGWYDEFTLRGTVGKDLEPGATLFFPTVQECADRSADWTDTSGSHDVPNPAPKITLTAAAAGHDHHDMNMAMGAGASEYDVGDLAITAPFSRATLPNAPVGGGFLTITNNGTGDDRLVAASTDVAGHTELHEMAMEGDVMKMRALTDGLPIPAGATVELKPGGYHLMLMDLKRPLVEGETVDVTLTFDKAGEIGIPLPIGAPNAGAAGHGGMKTSD